MLNIYGHFLSMPTNKVRLCVQFLELPHEYIHVDLQTGEHLKPEYLEINAAGRVPAIEDSGFTLNQSDAICKYLCAVSGPSAFYPTEIKEQAEVNQWIDFSSQHILQAAARLFFNRVVAKMIGEEADAASVKTGENMLSRDLPMLDVRLKGRDYVMGDNITLADISLLAALEPSEMCGIDLAPYPNVMKWRQHLMAKEFYQRVHKRFGAEMAG